MDDVTIYIGHDSSQAINTEICEYSIRKYNKDVNIKRLDINELKSLGYNRENEDGSTEFAFTRFAIPQLEYYRGVAIFMDSDFIWRDDPLKMMDYYDPKYAVHCVQHDIDHVKAKTKMDGQQNAWYTRKWWTSLMIYNCSHEHCKRLGIKQAAKRPGSYLHQIRWVDDAYSQVGHLPVKFNYLVGYYDYPFSKEPIGIHFTDGTPMHEQYANDPYADQWKQLRDEAGL